MKMQRQNIDQLIIKFIEGELIEKESTLLKKFLEKEENKVYFEEYVELNYLINLKQKFDYSKAYEFTAVTADIKTKKPYKRLLPYAAAVVLIISSSYFFRDIIFSNPDKNIPTIVNSNIETGTDKAVLTLEDGSKVVLEKGQKYKNDEVDSNGEDLIYKTKKSKTAISYNYLTIPRGGQYHVKLSDGTEVWLNSDSQLKYPVSFREGKTRQVELLYGEAYFDVSPSTDHKDAKFVVLNKFQEIEVLGTEFNIKAYKDETNVYTTLVEGEVAVGKGGIKQNLMPDQQSILDIETNEIRIVTVDAKLETSWRNGVFSFREKSLKEIMKILSRWYDVEVIFENKELELIKFRGVLGRHHSIETILSIMSSNTINSYEINGKTIILK